MRPFSKALDKALRMRKHGQGLFMRKGSDGLKRYYPGDVSERIEIAIHQWRYAALFPVLQSPAVLKPVEQERGDPPTDNN